MRAEGEGIRVNSAPSSDAVSGSSPDDAVIVNSDLDSETEAPGFVLCAPAITKTHNTISFLVNHAQHLGKKEIIALKLGFISGGEGGSKMQVTNLFPHIN